MGRNGNWLTNPEYKALLEFLVKRTKDDKTVMNVSRLIRDFKMENNSSASDQCWDGRIRRFCSVIHKFPHLDTDEKVKLIFALSAPVDYKFLEELRKNAEVEVDDSNRIVHYKKNGGGLELDRKLSEASNDQILEFLAEKLKKTRGIFTIVELCKKFKAETGNYQSDFQLHRRFREARKQIYKCELFDEDMKVRMMYATSTEVEDYALEELRKNATVVVDEKNRIEEYKKKDRSLYFNKKENQIDESDDMEDSDEEESGDDSEEEEQDLKLTTRRGRLSKKRFSDASLFNNNDDMRSRSQRNERSESFNTPTTSNKKRKISDHTARTAEKKKKETQERTPVEDYNNDYSFDISYQNNDNTEVKLEPFNGPLNDDTSRKNVINNGENFVEEIPAPTENFVAPKYEEMLMDVKMEEPEVIILNDQIDKGIKEEAPVQQNSTASSEDVQKDHTSLTTVLESFHDFINILDLPILSDLQKKVEAKIEECKGKMISNTGIYCSLELCLLSVNKNWEINESLESFRLEYFMIPFRHAVVTLKLPSLVEFQEKLKKIIGELRVHNKFVPVKAIRSALQSVIDNIINS